MPLVGDVIAVFLAGFLVLSGIGKLLNVATFRRVLVDTYRFPAAVSRAASLLVPVVEVALASLLLLLPNRGLGFLFAAGFLATVSAIAVRAWMSGASGDCGCLGEIRKEPFSPTTVVRAILLLGLSVVGLTLEMQWLRLVRIGVDRAAVEGLGLVGEVLLGAGAVLVVTLLWTAWLVFRGLRAGERRIDGSLYD